ncbi:HCL322Cp [Eremothecium sinecaudum]|uniref:HCL322Cp n=1 Tax=Eremothecium sinecaudum TaxID=45286 RepID=A0A120K1W8_9SACH|nr:HCL322Cp [Eremothecium sinecaudum]AMD19829.1 HCL322Cp [Eremothecium sinecaudum]
MKCPRVLLLILTSWLLAFTQLVSSASILPPDFNAETKEDYLSKAARQLDLFALALGNKSPKPPDQLSSSERTLKDGEIPQYVVDHCPLLHLYSEETYLPGDIADFVKNVEIRNSNGDLLKEGPLDIEVDFAEFTGKISQEVYLTSLSDFDKDPPWILGHRPDYGTGFIAKAPAILIVADKGNGWVDAFWFYFYPFNLGPFITGIGPWGSHLGDWEHSLVRFLNGKPQYIWMSAHGGGSSYLYNAIEKKDHWKVVDGKIQKSVIKRPLIFSARGTHANYASMGQHAHDVPFFFSPLSDFTDRGPFWDPSMNFYGYTYNGTDVTPSSDRERKLGTDWLYYEGHWGDKQLPHSDPRQLWFLMLWKYIDGPSGPLRKNLGRSILCERSKWWNFWHGCSIRHTIKSGEGLDAERNDLVGDNCGVALYKVRPKLLRSLLRIITWRGVFCFIMDYYTG